MMLMTKSKVVLKAARENFANMLNLAIRHRYPRVKTHHRMPKKTQERCHKSNKVTRVWPDFASDVPEKKTSPTRYSLAL